MGSRYYDNSVDEPALPPESHGIEPQSQPGHDI